MVFFVAGQLSIPKYFIWFKKAKLIAKWYCERGQLAQIMLDLMHAQTHWLGLHRM